MAVCMAYALVGRAVLKCDGVFPSITVLLGHGLPEMHLWFWMYLTKGK